jgi:hypothetical protein
VHLVSSPQQLLRAAQTDTGVTYAQAASPGALWHALGYADQYAAPNVFAAGGPRIEAWPQVRQYYTFAAERSVARAAWLPAPVRVTSAVGIREIRIYDGERLFRRFLLQGAREFEQVVEIPASLQHTLVLVAEDVDGGRTVSTALRAWKGGGVAPIFCGDRINHCDANPLMAKGPGSIEVDPTPRIQAGYTWDGGPRGQLPLMRMTRALAPTLVSDLGSEGRRGFAQRPILELADEDAVRVRSVLDTRFAAEVPVVNSWRTYGPLGGPTNLFRSEATLTAFNRPTVGPHPDRSAGMATRAGAMVSIFEHDVEFLADQTVKSFTLFVQDGYRGPFPVVVLRGRGGKVVKRYELSPGHWPDKGPILKRGDWIGVAGPDPSNLSLHVNRGAPIELRFRGSDRMSTDFRGLPPNPQVRRGDTEHFELLSIVDPLDAPQRGAERVMALAAYLSGPVGVEVSRGRLASTDSRRPMSDGLLEIAATDGAVRVRAGRPEPGIGVPLPIRVTGLNPNWSAGVFQHRGYVLGNYGDGRDRYRAVGVDRAGHVHAGLFVDSAEVTEVTIGHPVVCGDARVFVQVTARGDDGKPASWHVSLNNPTDEAIDTTCRSALAVPGLDLGEKDVSVPPGGYVVLR